MSVNPAASLLAIPWRYVDLDLLEVWLWETEHFEAKVTAEPHSFAWEIGDLVVPDAGLPRWLTAGRTPDFAGAEAAVREMIGKSYPVGAGYRAYAGALATTFAVTGGRRIDFGPFHGTRALITVSMPGGADQSFLGQCTVFHHELLLALDTGQQVRIQPSYVVAITGENGATPSSQDSGYAGVGRMYRGRMVHGCTGSLGFLPDTIEHSGAPCQVHESTSPRTAELRRP